MDERHACPVEGCDAQLEEPPGDGHSGASDSVHTHRDCPKCETPLTFIFSGPARGWHVDLAEKHRREQLGGGG